MKAEGRSIFDLNCAIDPLFHSEVCMSRSRRHHPWRGITTAESEKQDKRLYNRRYRRRVKECIDGLHEWETLPLLREYSDSWGMDKDGKLQFDPQRFPEYMRK